MTPQDPNLDPLLEQAIAEIRDEPIHSDVMEAAAHRVRARLEPHAALRGCADFQALIPDFRAGKLSEARALLLKDHLHECVACRKALEAASGKVVAMRPARVPRHIFRWAMAAALVIGAGLTAWNLADRFRGAGNGAEAVVESADGLIYRVADGRTVPLARGAQVPAGAAIRTAKDADAMVRLRDGSRVEMRERSGFSVTESGKDMTIGLEQGAIIVQAAKRHAGHLYVATRDCRVAVTGTVFSVNSGLKGSRVTVIEGTVLVAQDRHERVLHAGDEAATSPAMGEVPIRQEIAWSHNLDAHIAMLNAVTALNQRLDAIHFPDLRYSSRLLNLVPAQTVVYASIPNLNRALGEARQVFAAKMKDSPALQEWWQQNNLDQVIAEMGTLSSYLGDEIVVAAARSTDGHPGEPLILAEVKHPGFREYAAAEIAKMEPGEHGAKIRLLDEAGGGAASAGGMLLMVKPDLAALAPDTATLHEVAAGAQTQFAATPFGSQVAASYQHGVGLLFAADLQSLTSNGHTPLENVRSVIVQQSEVAGQKQTRAALTFNGTRSGVASWLAAPAPLRSLDFVSPEATLVWAAAVKQPSAILDEMAAMPQFAGLRENVPDVAELAAALGGEIAMAQDGPLLPTPSWKVAVEVYDPVRLQSTIERLVGMAGSAVELTQQVANGRTYYMLTGAGAKRSLEVHYVYTDGYLLAAPSQALLDKAIQYRATGYTLTRSATFTALIPHDQYANFSAMLYFNTSSSIGPLLEQLTPQQQRSLGEMAANLKPTLIAAYAEPDRITFATNGSLFGMGFGNMSLLQMLQRPRAGLH